MSSQQEAPRQTQDIMGGLLGVLPEELKRKLRGGQSGLFYWNCRSMTLLRRGTKEEPKDS